jgi:hypothetical protein
MSEKMKCPVAQTFIQTILFEKYEKYSFYLHVIANCFYCAELSRFDNLSSLAL